MSILNVNKINPVGGGSTITITGIASVTNAVSVGNSVTANAFYGSGANLTGDVSIADKIVHTGDTNTAIRFSGADTIKLETGGSERLRVDSTGDTIVSGTLFADSDLFMIDQLRHTGDTNTAIRFPAADTVTVETAGSERLRINNYGLVTAPFQYHLHAQRSNDQTGYNAQGDFGVPMIFNQIVSETKDSSLSSCFNTSTGVFTAPVLGLYHFCAATYSSGNSVFSQSWFTLNGSRAAGTDWHLSSSNYPFVNNNQVIRLAAGNTVGFKPYASGQSNLTLSANANHTFFKVTLIG